jgi:hypothetical protein
MANRHPEKARAANKQPQTQGKNWQKQLLPATLTLLAAGLLLIFGAVFEITVWVSPPTQALTGGMLMLTSFAASNALQKQWNLAAGWLLLGVAIVLWFSWPQVWGQALAYALGGAGLFFLSKEFMNRFWQQQRRISKKNK